MARRLAYKKEAVLAVEKFIGYGRYHRSITLPHNCFKMPPRPQAFRGSVDNHTVDSRIFASQRRYYVYEPPSFPLATIYVQDREAFYRKLRFPKVAEALLEQRAICQKDHKFATSDAYLRQGVELEWMSQY